MSRISIDTLPEELLLHVFSFFDSIPPSEVKSRDEPGLDLISSSTRTLKEISCVSTRWRRIILPLLFKHACLRVDTPWQARWSACPACSDTSSSGERRDGPSYHGIEEYHIEMVDAFKAQRNRSDDYAARKPEPLSTSNTRESFERPDDASTAAWAWRLYHVLQDFLHFVQARKLASSIRGFVLCSGRMLKGKLGRFPHQAHEWRYPAAAALWEQIFSVIEPDRVVVTAPPTELACLTNAAIDTFGDWAFGDMEYHTLELRKDHKPVHDFGGPVEYRELKPFPLRHPGFAPSSLLHLRDWTHIGLNEGSFLKAYGTYEYFERGPPSLVYSIKQCFAPSQPQDKTIAGMRSLRTVRSFTYTAIFPFANHADFSGMLYYLEELDLQYAPDPRSGILDDKERTGKAELQDCWQELVSAYQDLAFMVSTSRMTEADFPYLKRFTCRDFQIPMLQDDLDEIFTPLCLPVWVERQPVFTREAMSAQLPEVEGG